MGNEVAVNDGLSADVLESVLLGGDLERLKPAERVQYMVKVCESLGLNHLTKPFEFIKLNGKLVMYARRECTEQLRKLNGVSVRITSRETQEGVYIVTAQATDKHGRVDESTGAVPIDNVKGEARANAFMRAETKAKRRVTLSISGLGMLDESEVESVAGAQVVVEPHPMVEAAKATFPKAVARPVLIAEPISSSETEEAIAGGVASSSDLVPSWRLIEEGSKKALTYRSEFVPMDPQPKRTEAQNKLIHVLLAKRGLSDEDRRSKLRERFNKESTAELSMEEAGRLIDMLEDSIKRFGNKAETQAAKEKRQEKKADRAMKEIGEYLESLPEPSND